MHEDLANKIFKIVKLKCPFADCGFSCIYGLTLRNHLIGCHSDTEAEIFLGEMK